MDYGSLPSGTKNSIYDFRFKIDDLKLYESIIR